jgi:hypothetical protein
VAIDFSTLVLGPAMAAFGEPVTYDPVEGDAFALTAVVDLAHAEVSFTDGAPVSTVKPMLGVRLADFPAGIAPQQDDQATVRGTLYDVVDVEPDGQGGAMLVMQEAPNAP